MYRSALFLFSLFLILPLKGKFQTTSLNIPIIRNVAKHKKDGLNLMSMQSNGECNVIAALIFPNNIVFDVGASQGEWSEYVLSTSGKVEIYAFEPVPDSFTLLEKNLGSRINAYNVALANSIGERNFHQFLGSLPNNQLSTFYERPILTSHYGFSSRPISVTTDTIDSFCREKNIDHIDFLKIDTEGAEYEILCGAEDMLKNKKIKYIQFEYGGCFKDAKTTLKDICKLFKKYRYSLFRIIPEGLLHIARWDSFLENYTYSNYLAVIADEDRLYSVIKGL